jgi:hypothetical protein
MQSAASKLDAILSRFPGPVTLRPSRMKWLLVLLAGGVFAFGGYLMLADGDPWGWFVLVFFGAVAIVAAIVLLPGAGGLTLDRNGFRVANPFRGSSSPWHEVSGFEPVSIPPSGQKLVVYDDITLTGNIATLNVAIVGRNASLPDTYGLTADDLARLMTLWQDRAMRAEPGEAETIAKPRSAFGRRVPPSRPLRCSACATCF